ncbi:MAG: N-formylglutamate amidohydrolase [Rhodospirillaceae bacterium]|nr:N-formylglutamate amidohydrolase [Rhodospirillaceae bacterium]
MSEGNHKTETDAETHPVSACDLRLPVRQTAPLVFSSPHSGRNYPHAFVANAILDQVQLRRSEDAFVDEIFAAAPDLGAPLLRALFPRAYVDANREAFELDPAMFDEPLPNYVRTQSTRLTAGLGTIPRIVADGVVITDKPLDFNEAKKRIEFNHTPYHQALGNLLDSTHKVFGGVVLVDCHSMPSAGAPGVRNRALKNVDIVLGDCHGSACATAITDLAETTLSALGYRVQRNRPYAGGYITRHYGQPDRAQHALQIEINRSIYMDEHTIQRGPGMPGLIRDINRLIGALCNAAPEILEHAGPTLHHATLPQAAE